MKKLLSFIALLFVAGVLFTACMQNPNIDVAEISLSNGTWYIITKSNSTYEDSETGEGVVFKSKEVEQLCNISDGKGTFKSVKTVETFSVKLPSGTKPDTLYKVKEQLESKKDPDAEVTIKDTTVTMQLNKQASAEELAAANAEPFSAVNMEKNYPEKATIKTNKKRNKYTVSFKKSIASGNFTEEKYEVTFVKK